MLSCKNTGRLFSLLLTLSVSLGMWGQSLDLEVRTSPVNRQMVTHILKFTNHSEQPFTGTVRAKLPEGIRPLSRNQSRISVAPGDSSFLAHRLIVNNDTEAGEKKISYSLYGLDEEMILQQEVYVEIERREHVYLMADDAPVMMINPEDSVRITVTVHNGGNMAEEVTLVFNVPNLREATTFTEIKAVILPMEQRRVTYSFMASSNLYAAGQFPVHVTAMKGKEKSLFGSRTVTVQKLFSDRSYIDINPSRLLYPGVGSDENSLTLSYRQYNGNSHMLQLQGGGYVNLPYGYVHLRGNIHQYNNASMPMATNTSLSYRLHEHEFVVGNVSEQAELPLYGRGATARISDKEGSRVLSMGAIDQNYDLFDSRPWFSEYYSFFVQGEVGANNYQRGLKTTYLYQRNPFERADYNVGSMQWRTLLGSLWEVQISAHGASGKYDERDTHTYTGAGELTYRGSFPSGLSLNGSAYYSDPYFPGSRKGTLSFSQGVGKLVDNELYLNGSIGYTRTEPKSYTYNYIYHSENSYATASISLPLIGKVSSSLFYRHQGERSSSYVGLLPDEWQSAEPLRMWSNRLGGQWRWQSPGAKHSLYGALEGGAYTDPLKGGKRFQTKTSLNYAWQWLSVSTSYQRGAFHLYEQMMTLQEQAPFYRFTASTSINKTISKKMELSSSVTYSLDTYQGSVPSANISANYMPKENVALFLNAHWYQYHVFNRSNVFNVQVGITWNFGRSRPMSGKKSTIKARVYYDRNANNQYDEQDSPADEYLLHFDDKAFITNEEGKVHYRLVPYGEYTLKPMRSGRWFFDQKKIQVDKSRTTLDIPLKQGGTLRGSIRYQAEENSVEIAPKYEGLKLMIANRDKSLLQSAVTDARGNFLVFLPVGEYTITLDPSTLPDHTVCNEPVQTFLIEAGKINELPAFLIEVGARKINIRRF